MRAATAICRELTADRRNDGELLTAFLAGPSGDAFAELVRRHGPLVWCTCRRYLPDPCDAEDAFQATFLVLVRRARGLTHSATVAPWLYRVAVWTARSLRRKNARRLARQSAMPDHVPDTSPPADPYLKADLDAALLALPARYRDPILLCHLQGFSRREAAERLGCAEGTLSAWLSRGLEKLRHRLRGLDPAKVLTVATVGVPAALTTSTAKAAAATVVAAAGIPPAVSVLVKGVLHMFWVKKATAATFALCAVFAMGVGVGLGTRTEYTGAGAQDDPTKKPASKQKETQNIADEATLLAKEYEELLAFDAKSRAATDQLTEQLKKGEADPQKLKLLVDALVKLQFEKEGAAAKLKTVKDKLAKLKGDQKSPVAPAAVPTDLDAQLLTLVKELRALEDERKRLAEQDAETKRRAMDLDAKAKMLSEMAQRLQAERGKLAKPAADAAAGSYIELSVTGLSGAPEFVVREMLPKELKGAAGKTRALGPVSTRDPAALVVLLTRAKSDPNGPKEVRILTLRDTPVTGLRTALDACKSAGFEKVLLSEPQPNNALTDPRLEKVPAAPGTTLQNKAEFEEYLNKRATPAKP